MTTEELAKIIGVSRVTLSKVINGVGGVAPKTEKKIREYIEKYNFEPNTAARSLVGKEEPVIGLFSAYTDRNTGAGEEITSHFATELINLVVNEAQKVGYNTLVHLSSGSSDVRTLDRILGRKLVQGAILVGYDNKSKEINELIERGYPLVLINQERKSFADNMAVVNMADRKAAFEAVERMVKSGHKRILYIGGKRTRLPAIRREEGVRAAFEQYKDRIEKLDELDGDFDEKKAYSEVRKVYKKAGKERPTAIFAANDIMAIGAMKALKDLNINVPREVAVVGHDDIPISKYLSPALSTMRCDFKAIAGAGVNALVGLIENKEIERNVELDSVFVERDSFIDKKRED